MTNNDSLKVADIKQDVLERIHQARNRAELNKIYNAYLGKNGVLRALLRSIKDISVEMRPEYAREIHEVIGAIENSLRDKESLLLINGGQVKDMILDVTTPGMKIKSGHFHPLTIVERKIEHIFSSLGFSVIEGPEIEDEWHNFDALNIPKNHPAREMWDTFWIKSKIKNYGFDFAHHDPERSRMGQKSKLLLRTHTSPVQIRFMETHEPPFRIIVPGKVYRFEATDASHELQFNQVEGLMVGEDVSVANFKYVIKVFFERFFGKEINIRLRSSYFPFTEPSFEVDINCLFCSGRGCSTCAYSGWLEMGGAGMVHTEVFKTVNYDPRRIQGFAFGFGLERFAMMKYKIPDIRLFNSGDIRVSQQF